MIIGDMTSLAATPLAGRGLPPTILNVTVKIDAKSTDGWFNL